MSLRPDAKTEVRRNHYKVAVDVEEGRRKRENILVEIRKNKREESLTKKRRDGTQAHQDFPHDDAVDNKLKTFPDMVAWVWSDDPFKQLKSTFEFRKLLSVERAAPIDEVINSGVVPCFVEFLKRDDYPMLQFEAAWVLTNIASGTSEQTKFVTDHNTVPIFVHLLASPDDEVRELAVWALGNIAGESSEYRDLVLRCGALVPLLHQLNDHANLSLLRITVWTLANICRGKPNFDQVKPAVLALVPLIHSDDLEVLADTCWTLSYLADGPIEQIQIIIVSGVVQQLVTLLFHPAVSVMTPSLHFIGNILRGDDIQTQWVIDCGALHNLAYILAQNHKKRIKKQVVWAISNITAGNSQHIQAVLEANLIPTLVDLLQNAEFDIKKEAAWAISNATLGGSHDQIKYLVDQGCIKPLCDLLVCPDPTIITICLEALENILNMGEEEKDLGDTGGLNYYAQLIDDAEGLEKFESLQGHENEEIYEKAVKILETYWCDGDDMET